MDLMMAADSGIAGRLEWGIVSYALPGETESGDLHVVQQHTNGVLVGVIDGLGHGAEAAHAANSAVKVLSQHAHESVISLVRRCHQELLLTRGVVMSIASFDFRDDSVTWIGIGNVEGVFIKSDNDAQSEVHIVQRGGVVGYQLPQLHANVLSVSGGDTLILASDGIRPDFYDTLSIRETPERIARDIGERFRKDSDDALVLVARYR
jgi:serine phosphatase RsbU (regulator of sigma subunit)